MCSAQIALDGPKRASACKDGTHLGESHAIRRPNVCRVEVTCIVVEALMLCGRKEQQGEIKRLRQEALSQSQPCSAEAEISNL